MTVVSKPLADALTEVLLDAAPWYMKITKAQRFRWELIAHQAAFRVESMREQDLSRLITPTWPEHSHKGTPCLRCTMLTGTRRNHP